MPLFQKKKSSEKEMPKGKPSLTIAIAMKKKKMAKGGNVESAKEEKRPMPENTYNDDSEVKRNSSDKPLKDSDWDSDTWKGYGKTFSVKQGRKPAPLPIGDHKVNDRELAEKEYSGLMDLTPGPYGEKLREPMADGGPVPGADEESPHTGETESDMRRRHAMELASAGFDQPRPAESEYMSGERMAPALAEGGMINGDVSFDDAEDDEYDGDIFSRIKAKKMADGGEVDLEGSSEEDLNNEDEMSFDAGLKEQYDLSQLDEQPEGSNEKGDSEEKDAEDDHDSSIVGAIRRKAKKKV